MDDVTSLNICCYFTFVIPIIGPMDKLNVIVSIFRNVIIFVGFIYWFFNQY